MLWKVQVNRPKYERAFGIPNLLSGTVDKEDFGLGLLLQLEPQIKDWTCFLYSRVQLHTTNSEQ